jgi:hypothetical protein
VVVVVVTQAKHTPDLMFKRVVKENYFALPPRDSVVRHPDVGAGRAIWVCGHDDTQMELELQMVIGHLVEQE